MMCQEDTKAVVSQQGKMEGVSIMRAMADTASPKEVQPRPCSPAVPHWVSNVVLTANDQKAAPYYPGCLVGFAVSHALS